MPPGTKPRLVACKLMTTLLILTTLAIFLSTWFLFKKPKTKSLEKVLAFIHFALLLLLVLTIALLMQNLRFAGQFTNTLIAVAFLISGIILFGMTTSKIVKIYSGLIAIPVFLTEVSLLFGATPLLLPAMVAFLMFAPPRQKEPINSQYNLRVHQGGIMAPPNLFYLTQRKGLLDRQFLLTSSAEHFDNISKLEVVSFTKEMHVICKIYGESKHEFTVDTLQASR
jgi:hypothetical protein